MDEGEKVINILERFINVLDTGMDVCGKGANLMDKARRDCDDVLEQADLEDAKEVLELTKRDCDDANKVLEKAHELDFRGVTGRLGDMSCYQLGRSMEDVTDSLHDIDVLAGHFVDHIPISDNVGLEKAILGVEEIADVKDKLRQQTDSLFILLKLLELEDRLHQAGIPITTTSL